MNKYLLMSAAALFGSAGIANAGDASKSGHATIVLGNSSYCSTFVVNWNGPLYAVREDGIQTCGSSVFYEIGIAGKTKGIGNNVNLAFAAANFGTSEAFALDFSLPLKTGNAYTLYGTSNGSSVIVLNSGTYTVKSKAQAKSGSRKSLLSQAIEQLKERNAQ